MSVTLQRLAVGVAVIELINVSKRYRLGEIGGRSWWGSLFNPRKRESTPQYIWALRDVNLQVQRGEVVGIIGRNGAGKSTLLKLISRITYPTSGKIVVRGRVGSLLEVGTGFHPDLTGRENIYMNGIILGMKKKEIDRKLDEIVAFAGPQVEQFLDTPVKRYSSGMYMRLAFAVAAHLDTEILLVDEVLAVGDLEFQRKCLGKMGEVAKEGRTVLFVSHNLQAISVLTERVILLDNGRIICDGDRFEALRKYRLLVGGLTPGEYVNPEAKMGLTRARVITSEGNGIHRFGKPLVFEFEVNFTEKPKNAAFSFQIVDESMRPIVHLWIYDSEKPWSQTGKTLLRCVIKTPRLYMGKYSLITHLADRASRQKYETLEGICPFQITMDGVYREYEWVEGECTYLEDALWEIVPHNLQEIEGMAWGAFKS